MHSTYLLAKMLQASIQSLGHREVVIALVMALDFSHETEPAAPLESIATRLHIEKMITELYGLTK